MRHLAILAALAWSIACGSARTARVAAPHTDLVVRAARVLDVRTGRYSGPTVILVSGTRITGLLPAAGFDARNASRVIDLGDMTVVPGLIDAHVHLAIGGPFRTNALADLRAGFTTVADQGALTNRLLVLRDSVNAGDIDGPRVLAAGIGSGARAAYASSPASGSLAVLTASLSACSRTLRPEPT